ncbi:MAG TPA: LysR family transcriptional regulator [Pirellulaceae bacterium]|nr:LysR family transcriptional regulator [Pirellulaceae bacterium]
MNVKSLKVFCDVVARRSFSRAADENGISQSGASQIVNHLEEHLGVKLIDRTKRPFVLTPEGEAYYEGSRKLVQRYFALEEEVKTLHEEVSGRVSVASIYSIGLSHMNRFVQSFLKRFPKANVRLQYQHPRRVYELVESDQVDLGLVSYPRSTRTIKATAWREEPMVAVCSRAHPLSRKSEASLEDLHGLDLVAFDPDLEIRDEIDRALASRGVETRVAMEFDNTETIKRAVEINAGVALLPRPTVEREVQSGALVALPLSGAGLNRPIGIIQRRGKDQGQTASRFRQLLLQWQTLSADDASSAPFEIAALDEHDAPLGVPRDQTAAAQAAANHNPAGQDGLRASVTADFTDKPGATSSGVSRVKA